ncbi:NAD(P)H:quinone oxidoreductase [Muricoccus radiodurans]|uniref:NAD(P)H:quinone oxidoreductase n=1 Tax=Muricoccus radiodurans TaxID=2231721 RepID=UPI003CE896F1
MAKVLVLYYSTYGHVETMANAVAEGARSVPGTTADIKRVPELVPEEIARKSHYKLDQPAPIAQVADLKEYDAIIVGTPTRFGNMASQMKNFFDQAGGLWATDALVGKVGSVFTSTATPHGGQESTILATHTVLLHFGLVVVGLPYTYKGQMDPSIVQGGSPYGASTIAGGQGQLQPTEGDLAAARFQGAHVAAIAAKLAA